MHDDIYNGRVMHYFDKAWMLAVVASTVDMASLLSASKMLRSMEMQSESSR